MNYSYDDDDDSEGSDPETQCQRRCQIWIDKNFNMVDTFQAICIMLLIIILWLIAFSIFGESVGPKSEPFSLLVLFGTAKALGILIGLIKIPPIMGMIAMGVLLKNIGFINLTKQYLIVTAFLRKLTLLSILLPAAFSLDPAFVIQKSVLILILALLPSLLEVLSMCVLTYYMLKMPFLWCLLHGWIISAAAPAIIIPCLFDLEKQGFGNVNGIHTLITASVILDVVESVTLFGLVFSVLTSAPGEITTNLINGPLEILIGITYGITLGYVAQFVPHEMDWFVITLRSMFIGGGSLLSLFGSYAVGYGGAGVLGCFVFAFVANVRWRKSGWTRHNPVRENFKLVWRFFEPISFSLIGMEINLRTLDIYDALLGTATIIISTTIHFGASVLVTKLYKFSAKESIFVALTWISKATVQAALAPLTLDYAREENDLEITRYAQTILTVTVISILFTSPIGTIMLLKLGPKLLKKDEVPQDQHIRKSVMVMMTQTDHAMRRESSRYLNNRINNLG